MLVRGGQDPFKKHESAYYNVLQGRMYVGIIRFVFHVFHLILIRLMQRNVSCSSKAMMKHQHHRLETRTSLDLVMVIKKKDIGVDFLDEHLCPPQFCVPCLEFGTRVHKS